MTRWDFEPWTKQCLCIWMSITLKAMVQKWYWRNVVYPWVLSISPIHSPGLGEWWGENSLECNIKLITSNRWRECIISWRKLLWNRYFWQATIMIIREESLYRFLQCCPINDPRHHKAWPTIRWLLLLSFIIKCIILPNFVSVSGSFTNVVWHIK